jgi:nucleotide-binding universal stress UspA family protein
MKNILIPVDFSLHAMSAAETGAYIAQKTNATIHLIHVVRAPEDWEILSEPQQKKAPEIESRIAAAELKAKEFSLLPIFNSVTVIPRVFGGVPYKTILDYVDDYRIDIIIMGAHGASESTNLFIGSTAQKVIRSASCPVLSVKKDFKPVSLKRILFVSDFGESSIRKPLRKIIGLAESIDAKIDFAFINTPSQFLDSATIEKRIDAFEPLINSKKRKVFVYNDFSNDQGIINISKKLKTNMLSLATHNRGSKKFYQIGITETLLFHSDLPILSMVM